MVADIPPDIRKRLLFRELRPPQKKAVDAGLFDGRNLVVAAPTASGKTLIAEMAGINNLLLGKGKMLYIVPLRSIAHEKYDDFRNKYPDFKTALSIGDFDSSDKWLSGADIVITTSEKMDSLLRHRALWVNSVGTVVVDEVHMINDLSRGPTLEVLMTKLLHLDAQFICLSATIKNAREISEWVGAGLVESDYRPVELREGVFYRNKLFFEKSEKEILNKGRPEVSILGDTLKKGKQVIFFVSSRRYAEGLAKILSQEDLRGDNEVSEKVLNALRVPTVQCRKLSMFLKKGIAFHHAGLVSEQRKLIEEGFRQGKIKAICATPTLAMGVNLPAYRVVVRDLTRFDGGLARIPVLEYKQMAGRAGRPDYDVEGEAICLANSEEQKEEIFETYIRGEPEEIYSKLSYEPVLRSHILALIASMSARSVENLKSFFSRTFWAKQYSNSGELESKIGRVMEILLEWGMVEEKGGKIFATPLGNRVSELYLDPKTGRQIADSLMGKEIHQDFAYLQMVCNTAEMKPLMRINSREYQEIQMKLGEFLLLQEEPGPWDYDYEDFLASFKTALVMYDWINERTEDSIMKDYKVTPGELYNRVRNLDWVLYSSSEIARLVDAKQHIKELIKLRTRVVKGVKEELLPLVRFKGIGRFRARKLFRAGIKDAGDVRKNKSKVLETLGKKIGEDLLEQV
jgi:helicase